MREPLRGEELRVDISPFAHTETYQEEMENRRLDIEQRGRRRFMDVMAIFATSCCLTSYLTVFLLIARAVMY